METEKWPKAADSPLYCICCIKLKKCDTNFLTFLFFFQGGIFFFQLIDHYAASISIMFLAFFEVIAISWFYGVKRLCSNVKEMTGRVPSMYFRFCWLVAAPLLIMVIILIVLLSIINILENFVENSIEEWFLFF